MWSGGADGSVRWWGGKTAKVMQKSPLCEGSVSALAIDDTVLVAGYAVRGMTAYDTRSQTPLCTFSNGAYGGFESVQFDRTKLLTVSKQGQAALWRWTQHQKPHLVFSPDNEEPMEFTSGHFSEHSLILGGTSGVGYAYATDLLWN